MTNYNKPEPIPKTPYTIRKTSATTLKNAKRKREERELQEFYDNWEIARMQEILLKS